MFEIMAYLKVGGKCKKLVKATASDKVDIKKLSLPPNFDLRRSFWLTLTNILEVGDNVRS